MVQLLTGLVLAATLMLAAPGQAAAEPSDRHQIDWTLDLTYAKLSTDLYPWTEGGHGKLRFEDEGGLFADQRMIGEYRGRISKTVWAGSVFEYTEGLGTPLGVTEAHIDWRPVPKSANEIRVRAGAFYPPFSLENGNTAWTSPFTISFSAINTWLAEEIRPVGAEIRVNRHIGYAGSPHEISYFFAGFYGNDPAGTLLFWRGFALHDRQTRLNERLALPSFAVRDANGNVTGYAERRLDPMAEIDGDPGFYGGVEWRLRRRAIVQLARYDNRADPEAFSNGQWGWDTRFWHLAAQVALPGDVGLVTQWMHGKTGWLILTTSDGMRTPGTVYVDDTYDSRFLLLTKRINDKHRVSLRHDSFDFTRPGGLNIDAGSAITLGYEYRLGSRITLAAEWLSIQSKRDLWPMFYDVSDRHTENQLQLQLNVELYRNRR